jgi:hypothetical protein
MDRGDDQFPRQPAQRKSPLHQRHPGGHALWVHESGRAFCEMAFWFLLRSLRGVAVLLGAHD